MSVNFNKRHGKLGLLFLLLSISSATFAQLPFATEIAEFKAQDSIRFPPKNAVLFVGSSSFRLWKDVEHAFPGYTIINRGFGGSTLQDVINYETDIIFPYEPKQVVVYCGENDLAQGADVQLVFNRFKTLFGDILKKFPAVNFVYISIKPSPSRQNIMPKMAETNTLIKSFLAGRKNTSFVDVYHLMLDNKGNPVKELFVEDQLHMNAKGYALWRQTLQPYLMK